MSKRKSTRTCEEELDRLLSKVRKLERKIRDNNNIPAPDSEAPNPSLPAQPEPRPGPSNAPVSPPPYETGAYVLEQSDWLQDGYSSETPNPNYAQSSESEAPLENDDNPTQVAVENDDNPTEKAMPEASTAPAEPTPVTQPQGEVAEVNALDAEALEILGEDPSLTDKHGKNILSELATRFQHIATKGLEKETRKELTAKYPVPGNCLHIDAPKLNPEMKVAIPENISKREKGLESKQKQMANAISCLGDIITTQIGSKDKNKEMLQKLMDLGRLLCDIQHNDSVTRRNFVLFSLKKDIKEHLSTTKIDSFLFGESLSETLKSVKTINRSGTELKAESATKSLAKRPKPLPSKNLNRKAPGPAYRPPTQPARSYEPAVPRAPARQPPAHSSKTWPRHTTTTAPPPRRRY